MSKTITGTNDRVLEVNLTTRQIRLLTPPGSGAPCSTPLAAVTSPRSPASSCPAPAADLSTWP